MADSCSKTNRVLRGGIGFVIGGLLGAGVGYAIFGLAAGSWGESMMAVGTVTPPPFWAIAMVPLCAVAGTGAGMYIGARRPEC
jgi:hypothetical protein